MSNKWYIIILLIIGLATHFIFFGRPNSTVFDEVHFGKFVSAYYTHQYYYDIHPPLGKLMIAGFARLFDFKPEFSFTEIGEKFPDNKYMVLRFLPSLAGSLLPLIIFLLALKLNLKPFSAFMAGLFVALDNALLTQTKFILMDGFLYLFGFSSLIFYFRARKKEGNLWLNLFLFSILSAFAASIKWTGLTFLALAGLCELSRFWRTRFNLVQVSRSILFFVIIPLFVYFSIFAIHFSLLTKTGTGNAFMKPEFQKTLEGNAYEENDSIKPYGILGKFYDLNLQMYLGNQRLTASHPYGSQWYTWPLMSRPIYYWVNNQARIYFLGNPVIWWPSTVAVLMLIIGYLTNKEERNKITSFLLAGYAINLLPFIGIKRVMFLYHYAVALIFAILMLAYLIDKEKNYKKIFWILVVLAALSFIFFSPLTYGFPLTPNEYNNRTWFNGWI